MSNRKTAAELREMAPSGTAARWTELLLHLAAVEEEREAAPVDYGGMRAEHRKACDALAKVRDTLGARDKESAVLAAERAMDAIYSFHRKAVDAERLAADALRIGLEECERLRRRLEDEANHRRYLYGELLDCTRVLGIDFDGDTVEQCRDLAKRLGDREKVGEWWEVRSSAGLMLVRRGTRDDARVERRLFRDARVVHVTRWRKKR